jgi:hypothetical protein
MHPTHFELASLAVQVAHWRNKKDPQFVEAMEILGRAREHLANPWKAGTAEEYERLQQISTSKSYSEALDAVRAKAPKKFEEIVNAINDALVTHKRPAHPDLREPEQFPAGRAYCLRLITGEKDRRRRAPIMNAAGEQEAGADLVGIEAYWGLSTKILPYLQKFDGNPPTRKRRIGKRDNRGRIAKK